MARTESITFQVHPNDEQNQINFMQKFHWSLLSTQEIKSIDNHLERRGDSIYQVTNSERYIKLAFSRELDLPNLSEIKKLESEFNSLPIPKYPALFPVSWILWAILSLIYGIGIGLWAIYFFAFYTPKKKEAEDVDFQTQNRRIEILNELDSIG